MKRLFVCVLALLALQPPSPGYDPQIDYLAIMQQAALCGDVQAGRAAEVCRNERLDDLRSGEVRVGFDDLFLLAKLIQSEAGSSRIGLEWRMCVGEVALNRVASPEFPDTLEEVVFQRGQYENAETDAFRYQLQPDETSVQAALKLLQGERLMEPQVVFQANFQQGAGVYTLFYDRIYGYTYFCTSQHPEYYT